LLLKIKLVNGDDKSNIILYNKGLSEIIDIMVCDTLDHFSNDLDDFTEEFSKYIIHEFDINKVEMYKEEDGLDIPVPNIQSFDVLSTTYQIIKSPITRLKRE